MNTEKHIKITGFSNISWKDAIVKTIAEASKTVENLSSVTILEQKATINNNKISEYAATLDLSFVINENREEQKDSEDSDSM